MIKLFKRKLLFLVLAFTLAAGLVLSARIIPKQPILANESFSQVVYDHQGHLLRITLNKEQKYRVFTPLSQISPLLIETTLLQEDHYFYWHMGVNPITLMKAFWQTYIAKTRLMGASTISMQLARIHYDIRSKAWPGKLKQIIYALQLELLYSKNEILEAYLNLVSYGGNIEGIGAASLIYFNKPAKDLALSQALTLSVVPQNPLQRNPTAKDVRYLLAARQRLFVRWLVKHPEDRKQQAIMSLPWSLQMHKVFFAPHMVDFLLKKFPKQSIVYATLDFKLQALIEKISQNYLINQRKYGIDNLSVMLVDTRDMSVKALIGSADFFDKHIDGQVNGVHAKRSPGSTLKPFVYALALDQGLIHPYTILKDAPTRFGAYTPDNFDKEFLGPIRAKDALALSRNIPALILAEQLKRPTFYAFLQKTNVRLLKPEVSYGLSLVLGGAEVSMAELVSLYATLVNGGVWQPLRYEQNQSFTTRVRVLSPEASFLTLEMLKETPRNYLNHSAIYQPIKVAWKTGTSSAYRDAWSVGVVGPYVLAVWVGDFKGRSNPAFIGIKSAEPLFFALAQALISQANFRNTSPNTKYLHIKQVEVCAGSGMLPTRWCPQIAKTGFIPGKSPIKKDTIYREIAIDDKTGLRACKFDQNVHFAVYEFWPSNLLELFARAGVARKVPPAFMAGCQQINSFVTSPPRIVSPVEDLIYTIPSYQAEQVTIALRAQTAADIKKIFWFAGNQLLGESKTSEPLFWHAKPGHYQIRVVDEQGQSDLVAVHVQMK